MSLTANVNKILIIIIVLIAISVIPWIPVENEHIENDKSVLLDSKCLDKATDIDDVLYVIRGASNVNLFQLTFRDNNEINYAGCKEGKLFVYTAIGGSHIKYIFEKNKNNDKYQLLSKKSYME